MYIQFYVLILLNINIIKNNYFIFLSKLNDKMKTFKKEKLFKV